MKNKSSWILISFLLLALVCVKIFYANLDSYYCFKANSYYKKNNIEKAQEYFEKAFKEGLDDTKQREIYVNSIINSPLTTEAQEKLVNFLNLPIDDLAKLKVEYFLYDLSREIHRKYSENYILNAVYNQKIIRWGKFPITYKFENTNNVPKYFIYEFENAFTTWETVTEHQILFEECETNPNIIIKFEEHNPAKDLNRKIVVAHTTPNLSFNKLENMEILFYLREPQGKYYSSNQVYNIALHEIVHALGFMGHSNDKNNIMYMSNDSKSIINDTREKISQADLSTVELLYKIKPDITNVENAKAEYIPSLVLGEDKKINDEKFREAKIYINKAPNLPAGYISLAECYVASKDYTNAIKSLKKALKVAAVDDIRKMICFNLAVVYFYVDNLDMAKQYLTLSMASEYLEEKHYLLAEIYTREGKYEEAIKEYSDLIKKNPENIEYVISLTNIYVMNRDFIKARKVLKTYIKNNPQERKTPRFKAYGILNLFL